MAIELENSTEEKFANTDADTLKFRSICSYRCNLSQSERDFFQPLCPKKNENCRKIYSSGGSCSVSFDEIWRSTEILSKSTAIEQSKTEK